MKRYHEGSVHGRFQPLHNHHLKYILTAKKHLDYLWVGITQYDIHNLLESPQDPHREESFHNPLTFYERVEMLTNALLNNGLELSEFDIIPFPIEKPDCLADFLPTYIPIFTTICDEWNRYKIDILRDKGYKVLVLWEESIKAIDGVSIRKFICDGNETWKQMVPQSTIDIIEKYHIRDRIIYLKEKRFESASNGL